MIAPYKFNPIFTTYAITSHFDGSMRLYVNGKVYYMNAKDYYDSIRLDICSTIYMLYCLLHLISSYFMTPMHTNQLTQNDIELNMITAANMMSMIATKEYISPIYVLSLTLWYMLAVYYMLDLWNHIVPFIFTCFHIVITHFIFKNFHY